MYIVTFIYIALKKKLVLRNLFSVFPGDLYTLRLLGLH